VDEEPPSMVGGEIHENIFSGLASINGKEKDDFQ